MSTPIFQESLTKGNILYPVRLSAIVSTPVQGRHFDGIIRLSAIASTPVQLARIKRNFPQFSHQYESNPLGHPPATLRSVPHCQQVP